MRPAVRAEGGQSRGAIPIEGRPHAHVIRAGAVSAPPPRFQRHIMTIKWKGKLYIACQLYITCRRAENLGISSMTIIIFNLD